MAKSKIVVTFNSIPVANMGLTINNDLSAYPLIEVFKSTRLNNAQSTIGITVNQCAFNYYNAILLDYNNSGLYTLTLDANTVTIEATQSNATLSELVNSTSGAVTTSITNAIETPDLAITNIEFLEADVLQCKKIKVRVTTNVLATDITSPITISGNTDNPFTFETSRENDFAITISDGTNIATQQISTPMILRSERVNVSIFNTPTGSTATINVIGNVFLAEQYPISDSFLDFQYSLDNVVWKNSNSFSGLTDGLYTFYVKDQYGCTVTGGFQVSVFTPDISVTTPYTYLAKESSIIYKKDVDWNNCSIYRNDENTLSCEEKVEIAYPYYHLFQTCDNITTQFLSNYENISANVIKENGVKVPLTVVKRSSNIGATDKRDARYYNAENGQTGIFFTAGSTYNYNTGLVYDTYELNGVLPDYGSIGNYIFLDGLGWFEIKDIIYNDVYDADVLIIDYTYTGLVDDIIVSSVFNRENFEVYEFSIDMSNYENEEIQVEILQSDNSFGELNYLSEKIKVTDVWNDTIEVIWYNNTDTRVFYSTGLRNKARLYFETMFAGDDSNVEIHKTDTTTILIDSESYETLTINFDGISAMSTNAKKQLTKAFMHKEVYVDGIKYVLNSTPESENIPHTNQYKLTFKLTKTGDVFQSELSGYETSLSNVDVIGLIQSDNNYIKQG